MQNYRINTYFLGFIDEHRVIAEFGANEFREIPLKTVADQYPRQLISFYQTRIEFSEHCDHEIYENDEIVSGSNGKKATKIIGNTIFFAISNILTLIDFNTILFVLFFKV